MRILDSINSCAEYHKQDGGECKIIILNGNEIHCPLDSEGKIIDHTLRVLANLTNQE